MELENSTETMKKRILYFILFASIFSSSSLLIASGKPKERKSAPLHARLTPAFAANTVSDSDDKLYTSTQMEISNIYPNPAHDVVKFSYTLLEPTLKAKITIRNVLGSVIAEEELSHEMRQLDIQVNEYAAGMYFYTLSINSKSVITKKFLVKR